MQKFCFQDMVNLVQQDFLGDQFNYLNTFRSLVKQQIQSPGAKVVGGDRAGANITKKVKQ